MNSEYIYSYSARHHKWPKYLQQRQIACENGAPGCCTYYYAEFTVDSKSDFRFVEIHSVSELQLGMQDTVV